MERRLDYEKLDLVLSDDSPAISLAVDDAVGDVVRQLCWAHRMTRPAEVIEEPIEQTA